MRTVEPCIVIGSYTWDQDRVPADEFQIRIDALNKVMDERGWKAVLIYGDAAEHAALGYFSNYTPRLRWGMALLPRKGDPRLLVSMSPRDLPAMRLTTWIGDVQCGWNWSSVFDPWLAKLDGPGDIGAVGFDMMRPPLARSLRTSLHNRFTLQDADAAVATCRVARPRALSLVRAASELTRAAANTFVEAWRSGIGAEAAALDAERTVRLMAAQDVRTLVSLDGGRTLVPFSGAFARGADALAGYVAVKHMGYWADAFVGAGDCVADLKRRATAALDAVLQSAAPGASACALHAQALDVLKPYALHPVLSGSIGNRIGLSLDEGFALTHDASHTLATGDVYALHVGAHDAAIGGAFASAIIAVTATSRDLVHRSPSPA